jgi:nucleoid DNA-binding protein
MNSGREVQISGFGKFYPREQKVREGVNPQAEQKILARTVPAFSAEQGLKEAV